MRNTPLLYQSPVTADVTLVTTAETVVATLSGVSNYQPGQPVDLRGWLQVLLGVATTNVTLRIRQGVDATGTLVGEANAEAISTAAGSVEAHEIQTRFTPSGEIANASFVLTIQQTAATGNGTVQQANLEAEVA